jgi:glycosyltransferase involved in cell wall biosynthesis
VIQNWAPLADFPLYEKGNPWSLRFNFVDKFVFMFTGGLGFKHNPQIFIELAQRFSSEESVAVVVISEGIGADWLRDESRRLGISNMEIVGFQPYEQIAEVMAASDVLVAGLSEDASELSVPSKVLAYMCSKRPILLSIPSTNLAAEIIMNNRAGLVVSPEDIEGFLSAAEKLYSSPALRKGMGENARKYAEDHFDIERIGDRFVNFLEIEK